jgi:hypothetical protein
MMRRSLVVVLLLFAALCVVSAQTPPPKKTTTQKLAKLIEPWPNADVLRARRIDSEKRPLFQEAEPLAFTLESDFNAVNKDRDPESTKRFPAVLKAGGASISLNISGRGHLRRTSLVCSFIPLRLEFEPDGAKGTALDGRTNSLKLVTHCQNSKEADQFVLREYLAYRISNVVLPNSFRARLASVTYVDSKTGKTVTTRNGIILEDDGDVARRMEGRTVSIERLMFTDADPETLLRMMVFEFMIGNTDFSIFALHNVVLVQKPANRLYFPVPYDFDLSGFVRPPYAQGDRRLGLKNATDRLYRGPCLPKENLDTVFSHFREKKNEIMAVVNSATALESPGRREVTTYLEEFYSTIDRPAAVKRFFIDQCNKTTM